MPGSLFPEEGSISPEMHLAASPGRHTDEEGEEETGQWSRAQVDTFQQQNADSESTDDRGHLAFSWVTLPLLATMRFGSALLIH